MEVVCRDIHRVRIVLASDFKLYLDYAAGRQGFSCDPMQHEAADYLQGEGNWTHLTGELQRRKRWLGFRKATKTWVLRKYLEWRWLSNPFLQAMYQSSTDDLATDFSKSLLDVLCNDPLFAHLMPTTKDRSVGQFDLRGVRQDKGPCFRSAGSRTSLTGNRVDLAIVDDPESDVAGDADRKRVIRALAENEALLHDVGRTVRKEYESRGLPIPRSELTQYVVIGQPHDLQTVYLQPDRDDAAETDDGDDDPYPLNGSALFVTPALLDEGTQRERSSMPSLVSTDTLRVKRASFGGAKAPKWRLEYQIDTTISDFSGMPVKIAQIARRHARVPMPCMVVDPADGTNCEWGVAIGGMVGPRLHLLELTGFHGEAYEGDDIEGTLDGSAWSRVFQLAESRGVRTCWIEENYVVGIKAARRWLRKTGRTTIAVRGFRSTRNKLRRIIETLMPLVNNGLSSAEPHVLADPATVRQFQKLRSDSLPTPCDRIDAFAMLAHVMSGKIAVERPDGRKASTTRIGGRPL